MRYTVGLGWWICPMMSVSVSALSARATCSSRPISRRAGDDSSVSSSIAVAVAVAMEESGGTIVERGMSDMWRRAVPGILSKNGMNGCSLLEVLLRRRESCGTIHEAEQITKPDE